MVAVRQTGSTKKTEAWLRNLSRGDIYAKLDGLARKGVIALSAATPRESGLAAQSWRYRVSKSKTSAMIEWYNTDIENGFPVAIMLQYGYGTGTGGYVQGQDYINPAMRLIFDEIAEQVWRAVISA